MADGNIAKHFAETVEKEYWKKYPKGGKPYGLGTGISFEEWNADSNKLRDSRNNMHEKEIKRLSDIINAGFIRTEESTTLKATVPTPLKEFIRQLADTPACIAYENDFQKYYEGE